MGFLSKGLEMQAAHRSAVLGLGIGVFALAADQLSKWLVLADLRRHGGHIPLPGPVDLTLVLNQSNAFGVVPVHGEITRWALILMSFIVAGFLIATLVRSVWSWSMAAAFGFIMAGALGNAFDRLEHGVVIDFIDASKIGFHWVFNIADVSIDLGIALFVWSMLKTQSPPRPGTISRPIP